MNTQALFPALLQAFFTDCLIRQRRASPETVASYRDAFCLLFKFVQNHLRKAPSELVMEDLDASVIVAFLCWLENERGNSVRTRNARLAAIHSFFKYAALYDPVHSGLIQRVLAIPGKRCDKASVQYQARPETEALLAAPDQTTCGGHRDRTLLLLAVQTGLRVSELKNLSCQDVVLGTGAHVRCNGKGRKERCTPLRKETVDALRIWLDERGGCLLDPLFPNAQGGRLSRDGVEYSKACGHGPERMSVSGKEAGFSACSSSHSGHGLASTRGRPIGDRSLAWALNSGNYKCVRSCQPENEGRGPSKDNSTGGGIAASPPPTSIPIWGRLRKRKIKHVKPAAFAATA